MLKDEQNVTLDDLEERVAQIQERVADLTKMLETIGKLDYRKCRNRMVKPQYLCEGCEQRFLCWTKNE